MGGSIVKPVNTQAIEKATGTSWQDWCAFLEENGAADLEHNAIVKKARTFKKISGWWAQGIAVAYEQSIGRRKPGQSSDGLFAASVSRTMALSQQSAFISWCEFVANLNEIDGQIIAEAPTTSTTPKRLYWRCKFEDGSTVAVSFEAKSRGKTLIAIEHRKLKLESFIEDKKRAWAGLLNECFNR